MKYIEVKLTEDQARTLIEALEELGSFVRRQPGQTNVQDKQVAFIRRIVRKLHATLVIELGKQS